MRRPRAVRWFAALAVVLLPAFARPADDGPPGSRFLRGSRAAMLLVPSVVYPPELPRRWRFVARSEAEWRAIADRIFVNADVLTAEDFDGRMVVGLVDDLCIGHTTEPTATEVLGAVRARSGRMTVRWRYAYDVEIIGCTFVPECFKSCLLWSFPRTDGRVRFRRQPARYLDLDCR